MANLPYFSFQTEVTNGTLVAACVNAASPFLGFNTSLNCTTGILGRRFWWRDCLAPLATSDRPSHPTQPSSRAIPCL